MTIQKRSIVAAVLFASALVFYGAARHYSPSLVLYVVEQSLAQKAPAGTDPILLHEHLHALLSAAPNQSVRMERLLRISEYLEKVQHLTAEELARILAIDKPGTPPALGQYSLNKRELFALKDVFISRRRSKSNRWMGLCTLISWRCPRMMLR